MILYYSNDCIQNILSYGSCINPKLFDCIVGRLHIANMSMLLLMSTNLKDGRKGKEGFASKCQRFAGIICGLPELNRPKCVNDKSKYSICSLG